MVLQEISRLKPIPENSVKPRIEEAAVQMAFEQPTLGKTKSNRFVYSKRTTPFCIRINIYACERFHKCHYRIYLGLIQIQLLPKTIWS